MATETRSFPVSFSGAYSGAERVGSFSVGVTSSETRYGVVQFDTVDTEKDLTLNLVTKNEYDGSTVYLQFYYLNSEFVDGTTNVKTASATFINELAVTELAEGETISTTVPAIACHNGIVVKYSSYSQLSFTIRFDSDETNVEYEATIPEIEDLTVTGTSIDEEIVVSATITDATSCTCKAILDSSTVTTKTITDGTCTFSPGDLTNTGEYTFEIVAVNDDTVTESTTQTLTRTEPTIVSLEPDSVNQNINNQINISWVTTNQESYTLELDGTTYTGTAAASILLPANTLTAGTKTMRLTITYTSSWGDARTASKTVKFLAYGNPTAPVLDATTVYNTSTPTFTWNSDEQVAYELKVRDSDSTDLIATDEVISTVTSYTSTVSLDNDSSFTLLIRVKNQYGLWSEWASKSFTTAFDVPETPTIAAVVTNIPSVIVSFDITYTSTFDRAEIWRKSETDDDWIRIAYNLDNTVAYEDKFVCTETYQYKVRAIGTTGGIAESDSVTVQATDIKVKNFHFVNIEDFTEYVILSGDPVVTLTNNCDIESTIFAGCRAPKIDIGETSYISAALSFTVSKTEYNTFMNLVDKATVLLYRSGRGDKFYCQLSKYPTLSYIGGNHYTISFSIIEVAFTEGDFYSGSGNQPSLFFDGTWCFDATVELDGEA